MTIAKRVAECKVKNAKVIEEAKRKIAQSACALKANKIKKKQTQR